MAHLATSTLRAGCAALALSALAGCAVAPPSGPRSVAMPPPGKSYEQFTAEDQYCRQAAQNQVGPAPSAQQSTNQVVGSAVVGTAIGAVAGAALGSASGHMGGGAAVGGAMGALVGTSVGASNAQASGANLQRTYDIAYTQCMVAKGNTVQAPPQPVYMSAPYPYGYEPYYDRPHYYYRY
ncbi:MAG: glycine zipper family protein [Acetobacteraceae bacterium]|nr:glycine zipper family protein [Acetobacteraceae bacterium]